jgi:hypothetical protein
MKYFKTRTESRDTQTGDERETLLYALLIEAVDHRSAQGERTTLRDLHRLLDVPQPIALRLAHQLQNDGVAEIEADLADAFASVITLSPAMRARLHRDKGRRGTGAR